MAAFAYDDLGRRTSRTGGSGSGAVSATYGYDAALRLSSLALDVNGTSSDVTFTYGYNVAGQITSRTSSNDNYAWLGSHNADVAYTPNGKNQYSAVGGTSYTYDGRGNLTSDGSRAFSYNLENQLTQVVSAGATMPLYYDMTGRMRAFTAAGNTIELLYSGSQLVAEYNGGVLTRHYVPGPSEDEPLVWYQGSDFSDPRQLLADERGSITAMVQSSGAVSRYTYDEYGVPASTNPGRFQYTGQTYIANMGLYNYKARFYDAGLGRFLQTDPAGYGAGMNLYAYVGNDPVNLVDPSGMETCPGGKTTSATGYCDPEPYPPSSTVGQVIVWGTPTCTPPYCYTSTAPGFANQTPANVTAPVAGSAGSNQQNNKPSAVKSKPLTKQEQVTACIIENFSEAGDLMQDYGLAIGIPGAVVTGLAPEFGVGEAAAGAGFALYAAGTAAKDSASITSFLFSQGNGSSFVLSRANSFILNDLPEGPVRNIVEQGLDKAEHKVGLDKGNNGGC